MVIFSFFRYARFFSCLAAFLCLAAFPSGAPAAEKGGDTRILSEKMTYDTVKNQVVFDGKVHVVRPDMEMWSETLTLILDSSGKKAPSSNKAIAVEGGGKVEKIVAERNVRIKQDDKNGTCGKATYFVTAGKITMEQDPVLVDGENTIRGRLINYYTESGISEVVGNVDVRFVTGDNAPSALPGLSPAHQGRKKSSDAKAGR